LNYEVKLRPSAVLFLNKLLQKKLLYLKKFQSEFFAVPNFDIFLVLLKIDFFAI